MSIHACLQPQRLSDRIRVRGRIRNLGLFAPALIAALCTGLSAPAWGQSQANPAPEPPPATEGMQPPAQVAPVSVPADGLDLENADALRGVRKVALAGVALYVMTESSGAATSGAAFRDRSMAYVNSSLKVSGLDPARLQKLADAAHDRLVEALQARRIEVVPLATLQALPAYAALAAAADTAPLSIDASAGKGTVYSARGLPLIHMGELAWLNRMVGGLFGAKVEDPYVSLGDRMSGGIRKTRLDPAFSDLARAVGAPVLMARIVLSAAQVKASGGAWSLGASTQARDTLLMPAWTNRLWLHTPQGEQARVSLKFPLVSETAPGRIVDVTSTASKVADVATTLFTFAAAMSGVGRGVAQSTQDLELRTTPDWFEAVARPQVDAALQALAQGLAP